jgi:uncharacterized SAM-binding protein YcdF (DUF218 family)
MISLVQAALLPSGFATLLFLIGAMLLVPGRTRRAAFWLFATCAGILLLSGNGLIATALLSPLEYAYPALDDARAYPEAKVIVVLTGYAAEDRNLSLSAKMNGSSAFRVLEAANIAATRPDCRIVVTGAEAAAIVMTRQLAHLGVPEDRLSVDVASDNTAASARHVKTVVGEQRIFLVTSAGHMRRAVGVFRRQGIEPIPAPTDYQLPKDARHASWTTSAVHLQASDLAIHEYLGLAWYRLTDRI